jgi:peroxiredoxin
MRSIALLALCLSAALAAGELSGRRAPSFALPDSRLEYHDIQDYRGKIVLIDIMRTNCPNCQKLSGTLERIKSKYAGRVAVLSIVNPPDNQTTVAQYIANFGVTSPILFDCGQMAASYLKVTPERPTVHVPHLFIIDGQGMIRNDFGYSAATKAVFEGEGLDTEIDKLVGGAPGKK